MLIATLLAVSGWALVVRARYILATTKGRGYSSCALTLLGVWDRPWSPNALRYANHTLRRALARGLDVLEA